MQQTTIKNIIFDLGNTLVYFDFWYFFDGVSRLEKKLNPTHLQKFIIEKKLGDKLCVGKINHKQAFRIIKKKFELKISYKDFIYLYADIFWENTPMKNFLEKIIREKKFKVILLSNTDSVHFTFVNKNFPYINLIRNKVLSYKVGMMKPSPRIFQHTIKKFRLIKSETLLIDDMASNVRVASSLGLKAIHYKSHKQFLKRFNSLTRI